MMIDILLPHSQMHFWKWRRKAANCKGRAGKTQNQVERQAQKSRWFQSFCLRRVILIENTKRERWVESGNANYSSALPLLCFRNVERGTQRSFNSHHQHCAMLAKLTAQSDHGWHTGSFTPSNILPLPFVLYGKYYSSPCKLEDVQICLCVCWFSSGEKYHAFVDIIRAFTPRVCILFTDNTYLPECCSCLPKQWSK